MPHLSFGRAELIRNALKAHAHNTILRVPLDEHVYRYLKPRVVCEQFVWHIHASEGLLCFSMKGPPSCIFAEKHRGGPSVYSSIIWQLKDLIIISAPLLALSEREVVVSTLLLLRGLCWLLKPGATLRLAILWDTRGDLARL